MQAHTYIRAHTHTSIHTCTHVYIHRRTHSPSSSISRLVLSTEGERASIASVIMRAGRLENRSDSVQDARCLR